MTQDEIIDMAKAAHRELVTEYYVGHHGQIDAWTMLLMERFAKLVAAKEREAIWNILFEYAGRDDLTPEDESLLKHLADLIKARGEA